MPRDNHHRCADCNVLLARSYPYEFCPKHWRQRYNAPPGECRIDYFEAAANLARTSPVRPSRTTNPHPGSVIAASERSGAMNA